MVVKKGQVGAWIRNRRKTRKWAVATLAKEAGISRTAWYDLEAEKHPPNVDTQTGVARALRTELGWYDVLLAGGEPADVEPSAGGELNSPDDDVLPRVRELEDVMLLFVRAIHGQMKDLTATERGFLEEARSRLERRAPG